MPDNNEILPLPQGLSQSHASSPSEQVPFSPSSEQLQSSVEDVPLTVTGAAIDVVNTTVTVQEPQLSQETQTPANVELSDQNGSPLAMAECDASNDGIPGKEEKDRYDEIYKIVDREYKLCVEGVSPDGLLGKFRLELDKMFKGILRSRDHIAKIFDQYRLLHGEYMNNLSLTQEAMKSSVQDQQTLKALRNQIRKANEVIEASSRREEVHKEDLRLLRGDILTLQTTMKEGVGLSAMQERTLNELIHAKEQAAKELDVELDRIAQLRSDLSEVGDKIRITDMNKRDLEREIYELKEHNAQKKAEIDAEVRNKEKLERDLRDLRVAVAMKTQEVRTKQDSANRALDEINILESQIKAQKQNLEKLLKDQETLNARMGKLKQECSEQIRTTNGIVDENAVLAKDLKLKESELSKMRTESRKMTKIIEQLSKKNKKLEEQKLEAETERKTLRVGNDALQNDILCTKRIIEHDKKIIDDLKRERDILIQNLNKTKEETFKHTDMALIFKQSRHNMELDIHRYNQECMAILKQIKQLEAEKDAVVEESTKLHKLCATTMAQIKEKETEIFEFKKKMAHADTRLKHQQNLYEAVQSDRNLHSKLLLESQNEIAEMKRKLKIMNFQINGYKEDIISKEDGLERETAENEKLRKDIDLITDEIRTLKHQNELAQAYIRCQVSEEVKLNQFVKEADMERTRQENALQVLTSERDNLSSQLIHQNEELAKVYNRLKTNQFAMLRSEKHYYQRLKTIRAFRQQIWELRRTRHIADTDTSRLTDMKKTINALNSDLVLEKTRLKALEEELKFPVNVHRWRKLEGSNPKIYELIQLLQALQKKLIAKTEEDQQKSGLIQEKEQHYLHLKNILGRQVGPEALEQITEFDLILKEKTSQLRHMGTEINMYRAQVKEYQYQIQNFDTALADIKIKYRRQVKQNIIGGNSACVSVVRNDVDPEQLVQNKTNT